MNILYGAGKYARDNVENLKNKFSPVCFCDSDNRKHGAELGGIEILPLDTALARYPEATFVITLADIEPIKNVYKFLVDNGVLEEKIQFAKELEWRESCDDITDQFHFFNNPTDIYFCCKFWGKQAERPFTSKNSEFVTLYDSNNSIGTVNKVVNCQRKIIKAHAHGNPPQICVDCGSLHRDLFRKEPEVFNFIFGSNEDYVCNFKCIYCGGEHVYLDNILPVLRDIDMWQKSHISGLSRNRLLVSFAKGELFIRQDCDAILDFIKDKDWDIGILTNGSVYKSQVAEIVRGGQAVMMDCSLDSGTAETFRKIKGVDCYGKVLQNLRLYCQAGAMINLKYIILDGINTNADDLTGFFAFVRQINATVTMAADNFKKEVRLTRETMGFIFEFIEEYLKLEPQNIPSFCMTVKRNFNPEDAHKILLRIEEGKMI